MGKHLAITALAALLCGAAVSVAVAQEETTHPGSETNLSAVPNLKLTSAQKQTIYSSISGQKQKETEPPTFRAAVGAVVPTSVELRPLPKTIVDLVPELKDYEYAMLANQVVLVDPKNKQVVEVIN
jgi:Protein of unknown function (DUF1236)